MSKNHTSGKCGLLSALYALFACKPFTDNRKLVQGNVNYEISGYMNTHKHIEPPPVSEREPDHRQY